jgi:WhiB family transcriptional regulator, redox-sensing transcriptional regulator
VSTTLDRERWRYDAACRKQPTAWWFATKLEGSSRARRVCDGCTVKAECLEYALERPALLGLWASTTTQDRVLMRELAKLHAESELAVLG